MNELSGVAGPLQDAERIEAIDVLRGFALCGILFVNIMWFKAPGGFGGISYEGTAFNRLALAAVTALAQGKILHPVLVSVRVGLRGAAPALRGAGRGGRIRAAVPAPVGDPGADRRGACRVVFGRRYPAALRSHRAAVAAVAPRAARDPVALGEVAAGGPGGGLAAAVRSAGAGAGVSRGCGGDRRERPGDGGNVPERGASHDRRLPRSGLRARVDEAHRELRPERLDPAAARAGSAGHVPAGAGRRPPPPVAGVPSNIRFCCGGCAPGVWRSDYRWRCSWQRA